MRNPDYHVAALLIVFILHSHFVQIVTKDLNILRNVRCERA